MHPAGRVLGIERVDVLDRLRGEDPDGIGVSGLHPAQAQGHRAALELQPAPDQAPPHLPGHGIVAGHAFDQSIGPVGKIAPVDPYVVLDQRAELRRELRPPLVLPICRHPREFEQMPRPVRAAGTDRGDEALDRSHRRRAIEVRRRGGQAGVQLLDAKPRVARRLGRPRRCLARRGLRMRERRPAQNAERKNYRSEQPSAVHGRKYPARDEGSAAKGARSSPARETRRSPRCRSPS